MSFSYNVKAELCRAPVQRLCCARAEAYGVLLYCNTFTPTEVRIITGNPAYAERLPRLFSKAFRLHFDQMPEDAPVIIAVFIQKSSPVFSPVFTSLP